MLNHPAQLAEAARSAGIPVPPDPSNFKPDDFPYFFLFCRAQLGRPMVAEDITENARRLMWLPADELKTASYERLFELGCYPVPYRITPQYQKPAPSFKERLKRFLLRKKK